MVQPWSTHEGTPLIGPSATLADGRHWCSVLCCVPRPLALFKEAWPNAHRAPHRCDVYVVNLWTVCPTGSYEAADPASEASAADAGTPREPSIKPLSRVHFRLSAAAQGMARPRGRNEVQCENVSRMKRGAVSDRCVQRTPVLRVFAVRYRLGCSESAASRKILGGRWPGVRGTAPSH
jgi:hypothetical protein